MKLLCILQQGDLSVTDGSVLSHRLYFDFANRIGIDGKDGEDGTEILPDAVLEILEVKPGEEVRFEVDDNFYAVRLLSRIEAERLDYLNWMHNKHCPSIEEMIAESRKQATQNIVISRILDGMPAEKIAEGYEVSLDYVKQLTHQLKMDIEEAKAKKHKETGSS